MNDVVPQTGTALVTQDVVFEPFELQQQALVLPRIYLMQPLSELVVAEKAKYGDFVNNSDNSVIGNINDGVEVIPLSMKSYHVINEQVQTGNKVEEKFVAIEPIVSPKDMAKPWKFQRNGKDCIRQAMLEFYVMCPSICAIPMSIIFKGMSKKEGDKFYTSAFAMAFASKKMPFQKVFLLTGTKTKNDNGMFAILNTKVLRDTNAEELSVSSYWFKSLKTAAIYQDESVVSEDSHVGVSKTNCDF